MIHTLYCPDRHCDVRMAWMELLPRERARTEGGPVGLVCLDFGKSCMGVTCPLSGAPLVQMQARLWRYTRARPC